MYARARSASTRTKKTVVVKCDKVNTQHGYDPNMVIAMQWILYSRDFTAEFPANHVLNVSTVDSVKCIVQDILAQDTGAINAAMLPDVLLEQQPLQVALKKLHSNWKPSVIKNMQLGYCSSPGDLSLSNCTVEKGIYCATDIFCALGRAPIFLETNLPKIVDVTPINSDQQQTFDVNAFAATNHCTASAATHDLVNSNKAPPSPKNDFSDEENNIEIKSNQPSGINQFEKKRKIDCCTSPLSTERASKRMKKDDQQNGVLVDKISLNHHAKNIPTIVTDLEKELITQELAYFAPDEEQKTVQKLQDGFQLPGDKSTTKPLASNDNTDTNSDGASKKRQPSTTSTTKQHEDLPSLSTISVQQQMVVPSATQTTNQHEVPPPLNTGPVSLRQLLAFINVSVRRLVPLELFGSASNRTNFLKAVRAVLTAGRLDEVYLQQLMWKAKITRCKWASGLGSDFNKSFVVAKMWLWLLQRVVLAIVQAFFYATETSKFNNMIIYYQKHIWCHLTDKALNELEKKGSIRPVADMMVECNPAATHSATPAMRDGRNQSRLRFIPKSSGLRPIYPVKSAGVKRFELLKMRLLLNMISKFYERGSVNIGNKTSLSDVWINYNNKPKVNGVNDAHLFVVKVDVTDAFGSVLHNVLLDIIHNAVETLSPTITFGVFSALKLSGKPGKARHYILFDKEGHATEPTEKNGMPMWEVDIPIMVNTRNVEKAVASYVQKLYISAGRNRKYLVNKGIAQGGILSSELCDLYYNTMYYMNWKACVGPHDLLLHSVDDFLFISPSKASAEHFLCVSGKGVEPFNCFINPKKTIHNICDGDQPRAIRVPFCGLTLCSLSRQLMVSAALIISYPARYTLKLNPGRQPGLFIAKRLQQVSLARLPDTVIHPAYTTVAGLLANVFRVGLMAGARLEAMVVTLLCPREAVNGRFLGSSVVAAGDQVWRHVARLWGAEGATSPVTKDTVLLTYIEGVLSSLGLKRHVLLTGLVSSLRRLQGLYHTRMTPQQRHLVPGILTERMTAAANRCHGHAK